MKFINQQYYNSVVAGILKEKEKQAELLGQSFIGLSGDELAREVSDHLGEAWSIKAEKPMKFSKSDINAVANARFYRKTGVKLLMGLLIIVLTIAVAVKWIPNMTELHYNIYITLCGVIALVFIYVYSRKQSKVRKELWRQLGREESEEDK